MTDSRKEVVSTEKERERALSLFHNTHTKYLGQPVLSIILCSAILKYEDC